MNYHRTLVRQIKKYLGEQFTSDPLLDALLNAISETYTHFDEDRALIERSLEISSRELGALNTMLRQERDKIIKYIDIAGVLIVVLNTDATVALINRRGTEILGYPNEEIIGKNWFSHFIPSSSHPRSYWRYTLMSALIKSFQSRA